ncbi:hypothetical protein PQI66_07490 [Corynebacterium sp. USCH3]|uniref:SLAC1 family transporter n=1 Tax=Corynebacterium sp. USCH3 TaxID=3024840 RepID=UPI00309A4D45
MDTTTELPPPGPAWGGVLMGVSITAAMLGVHVGQPTGGIVTVLATAVLLVLTAGGRSWLTTDLPSWSMVTMGILALGSAADGTLGLVTVHRVTWILGTIASVLVFTPQAWKLVRGALPRAFPATLPLVTPMVAATNAAQLGHPLPGALCLAASLAAGVPAFILVYLSPGRRPAPPAAATTWIPLGIVGQSSTAALLLTDGTDLTDAGRTYAAVMLTVGVPAALWALRNHWGTLLRHSPVASAATYGPAWWSATFPVGTCSLGTHQLAVSTGAGWLDGVSAALLVLLVLHVTVAAAGLVGALGYRYVTSTGE